MLLLSLINVDVDADIWVRIKLRLHLLGWLLIHHRRLLHHRLLHHRRLLLTHHHLRLLDHWRLAHHRLIHHGLLLRHGLLHHHWLLLRHHIGLLLRHYSVDSSLLGHVLNVLAQGSYHAIFRRPDTLKTDLTRLLALVVDRKPFIDTSIDAKSWDFDCARSYLLTAHCVFIEYNYLHIIANVLDVDVEDLVPLGSLACTPERECAQFLLSSLDLSPGVHFGEPLCVAGQLSLDNVEA